MKKTKAKNWIMTLGISFLLTNCSKESISEQELNIGNQLNDLNAETVSFQEAIIFFNSSASKNKNTSAKSNSSLVLNPDWNTLVQQSLPNTNAVLTNANTDVNRKGNFNSELFFIKIDDTIKSVIYTIYKDSIDINGNLINARFFLNELNGDYIDGYKVENGNTIKRYIVNSSNSNSSNLTSKIRTDTDPDDCWNTDNLPDGDHTFDTVYITGSGGGSPMGSWNGYTGSTRGSFSSTGGYSNSEGGTGGGSNGSAGGSNGNTAPRLTAREIKELAGAIVVDPPSHYEDDKIDDSKLTGKDKCAYELLKTTNGNLFKETIGLFGVPGSKYDLKFTYDSCNNDGEMCTNAKDLANNNITIKINNTSGLSILEIATNFLHEGIHAEIYRYVHENGGNVDPNDRINLYNSYIAAKVKSGSLANTDEAQHQHMADRYVYPIARAIREIDNKRFSVEHYLPFG